MISVPDAEPLSKAMISPSLVARRLFPAPSKRSLKYQPIILSTPSFKISRNHEKINSIEEINNAPLYHGDLKLVGVLKHTDESKSIAIIDSGVEQKTYFIGNAIENKNVFIVKILIDKITVSDGTTYYSLILLE